ncbi:MAG TPA: hypothetical protein VN962_26480 [Polyangia bacterium]|nr:hypothetical protein [Polyangia bacterium]
MQRLRDTNPRSGSAEAELAQAVAAMPPVMATAARQQRILASVTARRRWRPWSGAALLRPALAGALLMVAGAAGAAATVGHGWVGRTWRKLTETRAAVVSAPAKPPAVVATPVTRRAVSIEAPVAMPVHAPAVRAPVRARLARGEDPTTLVAAVRALRSEHDPRRAARLLDAYLRSYPRGALAEEALALQIEAAAALQSPRAADFARQYLRLYPTGRFQTAAHQALTARF